MAAGKNIRSVMGSKLEQIYKTVDKCIFCSKQKNYLQHIHGFGPLKSQWMLVLVNPTHKNLSSHPDYLGPRFPFIGVRQFWKVLADGGLISKKVAYDLPLRAQWTNKDTEAIQNELLKNKIFITNIVKCCYPHGNYPEKEVIKSQLGVLKKEINLIKPKQIIAFSTLVHKTLTRETIKLSEYWKSPKESFEKLSGLNIPVIPVYFPIGRGNPKKAAQVLRKRYNKFHAN